MKTPTSGVAECSSSRSGNEKKKLNLLPVDELWRDTMPIAILPVYTRPLYTDIGNGRLRNSVVYINSYLSYGGLK